MRHLHQLLHARKNALLNTLRIALLGSAACACALAQTPPPRAPMRLGGTVVKLEGQTLTLKTAKQPEQAIQLTPDVRFVDQKPALLSDVQSGKFIGVTAVEATDGKLHAREIHIFAESMRGAGEGHYPMGSPKTTMTNGNVASMTNGSVTSAGDATKGLTLTVAYKGGQREIEAAPNVPVTMMSPGTQSLIKPGAQVVAFTQQGTDGSLSAGTVIVNAGTAPAVN